MDGNASADHGGYEERRRTRPTRRNATDIGTTYVHWLHNRRATSRRLKYFEAERPSISYITDILPPAARRSNPADHIPAKHLHSSLNKIRHPVNVVKWTPEGRRLLTGSHSGEFTLWNGTGFNFETIMQAHDTAVRAVSYAHNDEWLISADQDGIVKYWQTNFNNVKEIQAHSDVVRDLAFAPTDSKFVTASDDASLKIFDFAGGVEESQLLGHQWDAKCVDWHPTKGLLVSGSKDHTVRLWDPRTGRCLTTLSGHKNTVAMTKFEPTQGVLLASCARDPIARVFDLRMMRDVFLLKGHENHISALTWHPIHSSMLTTGGGDGSMFHYLLDEPNAPAGTDLGISPYDSTTPADAPAQTIYPAHKIPFAHEYSIWSLDWHPLGHILASGSNDRATRFWTRPRPGEVSYIDDRWHIGQAAAEAQGTWKRSEAQRARDEEEADEADGLVDQQMPSRPSVLPGLAGLPGLASHPAPAPFPDGAPIGGAQPVSLPGFSQVPPMPFPMPGSGQPVIPSPADLDALIKSGQLPMPPLAGVNGLAPPLGFPPPGLPAGLPPLPPGFVLPPGFAPPPQIIPPPPVSAPSPPDGANARRRAPLPSQKDSLKEEQRHGRFTKAR